MFVWSKRSLTIVDGTGSHRHSCLPVTLPRSSKAFVKEWKAVLDLPEPHSLPYWRMSQSFCFSDPRLFYGWTRCQHLWPRHENRKLEHQKNALNGEPIEPSGVRRRVGGIPIMSAAGPGTSAVHGAVRMGDV